MKKKNVILIFVVIMATILILSGCSKGYTPKENEQYFKVGDVYRVIELSKEPPKIVEKYGLNSLMIPADNVFSSVEIRSNEVFSKNSIFFKDSQILNKDGVLLIYDMLKIERKNLHDEYYTCNATGLYSFNEKISYPVTSVHIIDLSDYPRFTVLGDAANVSIYTFNYVDYSIKDGTKMQNGSFEILVSGEDSRLNTFIPDNYKEE